MPDSPLTSYVKHTAYLPADFVRALQKHHLEQSSSSYGAVQAFLRWAVSKAIEEWSKTQENTGSIPIDYPDGIAWVEVPAREAQVYECLVKYLERPAGSAQEREWKLAVKRVAQVSCGETTTNTTLGNK